MRAAHGVERRNVQSISVYLIAAGAVIFLLLGTLHLVYTFFGRKFFPRESELQQRMQQVSPYISRDTTMWKAWIGFNASHSLGAMLFGVIYSYLALLQAPLLLQSLFLQLLGFVFLAAFALLGYRYWFSVPFRGIVAAMALYVAGVVIAWG